MVESNIRARAHVDRYNKDVQVLEETRPNVHARQDDRVLWGVVIQISQCIKFKSPVVKQKVVPSQIRDDALAAGPASDCA